MLLHHLQRFFLSQSVVHNFFIAYSGGMDSHALLDAACELKNTYPLNLKVIHINHGLSKNANQWALHCEKICKNYQIPLTVQRVDICIAKGDSLEEIARAARYKAFANLLSINDVLLTAHQQDDQAETLLLQLLRGAGTKGLASMPEVKSLGKGKLIRPLLGLPRAMLEAYAISKQLHWIEDESNENTQLTRNFLRNQVLPLLKKRWPTVTKTLTRTAMHMKEADQLLNDLGLEGLQACRGLHENTLSVAKLRVSTPAMQRLILRTWIMHAGFPLPTAKKLNHIQTDILYCKADRSPLITWQGTEVRRYRDDLFLSLPKATSLPKVLNWELSKTLYVPELGILNTLPKQGGITSTIQSVVVRFRQGGEVIRLTGSGGRQSLKKLFQTLGVPPWERNRIPLIYHGDELIAAVGYFVAAHVRVSPNELGFIMELQKAPS